MRTLVIETATSACSVALLDGDELAAGRHQIVGRGHAERLIPMIAELPGEGRAERVLVDCGPGSFTGIRVGLAAARAFGFAWNAEVFGYSSTALIAASAFAGEGAPDTLAVALIGGHGELFVQRFGRQPMRAITALASLKPDAAAAAIPDPLVVGSGAAMLVEARGHGQAMDLAPRAADVGLLPPDLAQLPPRPMYGRAPDAKLPA